MIDIPRDSPIINRRRRISKEEMNSNEDQPPKISPPTSPIIKHNPKDDDEKDNAKRYMDKFKADRANKLLESKSNKRIRTIKKNIFFYIDWQNLYETSVETLHSDEEQPKHKIQKPFFLNRPPSVEEPPSKNYIFIYSNQFLN